MTEREYYDWLDQAGTEEKKYYSDRTAPFSDYLKNPDGKYVIAITKSQYVFYAKQGGDHAIMATDLIKEIRPDIEMDVWGNAYNREEDFRDHNVFILGYSHYSLITLPSREKLSIGQYKEIEKIILNIKEYNENNPYNTWELFVDAPAVSNIKGGNYEKREEELLISLEKYITDDYIKTDKNIIGKAISENKTL